MNLDRMVDDALRFMRVPPEGRTGAGKEKEKELVESVRAAFDELETYIRPRSVWARFPVSVTGAGNEKTGIEIAGIEIQSADLARLMSRSRECCLMAVTLGPETDRRILLAQKRGMLEGMTLDACASVRADALCDQAESEIRANLREGEGLTRRFSPGYGDVPLTVSEDIIAALDATRRIGLSMTRSFMMTPVKSVTALLGVTACGDRGETEGETETEKTAACGGRCALCENKKSCPYAEAFVPVS